SPRASPSATPWPRPTRAWPTATGPRSSSSIWPSPPWAWRAGAPSGSPPSRDRRSRRRRRPESASPEVLPRRLEDAGEGRSRGSRRVDLLHHRARRPAHVGPPARVLQARQRLDPVVLGLAEEAGAPVLDALDTAPEPRGHRRNPERHVLQLLHRALAAHPVRPRQRLEADVEGPDERHLFRRRPGHAADVDARDRDAAA